MVVTLTVLATGLALQVPVPQPLDDLDGVCDDVPQELEAEPQAVEPQPQLVLEDTADGFALGELSASTDGANANETKAETSNDMDVLRIFNFISFTGNKPCDHGLTA